MAELREIKDDKVCEQASAEEAITTRPLLIMLLCLIIGGILLITGINLYHGDLLIISGIVVMVTSIIWYVIISPLFKVLANISENLREINRKLK